MIGQKPLITETFSIDTVPTSANVVVVASTATAGNVMLPTGVGVAGVLGVVDSLPAPLDSYNVVPVIMKGIALVQSDGSAVIAFGDSIEVANATGQVKTGTTNAFGKAMGAAPATAGALVPVLLN